MYFVIFLAIIFAVKLLLAPFFPIIGDEAYYWLWSKHLAWGYIDHPPMIAYVNYLITVLFGYNELAHRLTAILILLLISVFIYLTGKELYDKSAGAFAAIVFNLLPTFFGGGIFLIPQTILFLFWSASFYLMVMVIKKGKEIYWYLLGLSLGLGMISDFIMPFFLIGVILLLLFNQTMRQWLNRKEPYLAGAIALIIVLPMIIWNLQTRLGSMAVIGKRIEGGALRILDNLANYFGLQMALFTPVIFIMTICLIIIYLRAKQPEEQILSLFSAVVFIPFLILSPILSIGGHWPATSYLPAIINSHRSKKATLSFLFGFALLVNIAGMSYFILFYPVPDSIKGKEMTLNHELPKYLRQVTPPKGQTYYFANDLGLLGLVSFYGQVETQTAVGRVRQRDLWGNPPIKPGDNIIYFALNETPLYDKLKKIFGKVKIEARPRLFNRDSDLANKTQIFICRNYLGGVIP